MKQTLAILALVALATQAVGRTYWVNNDPLIGDDAANGRRHAPLLTIAEAVARVNARDDGDDIKVVGGTPYINDPLSITNTSPHGWSNPVVIEGVNGPVITGAIEPSSWNQAGNIFYTACPTSTYMVVEDGEPLRMMSESYWIGEGVSALSNMHYYLKMGWTNLPGVNTSWPASMGEEERIITSGTNNLAAGTWAWSNNQVYVWCTDSNSPATHTMEVANRGEVCRIMGDYIEVRGFNMRCDNQAWINNWSGTQLRPSTKGAGIRMYDCTVSNSSFIGMSVSQPGSVHLEGVTIDRAGCLGLGGNMVDSMVVGCVFTRNNFARYQSTWQSSGVKLTSPVMGVTFQSCVASNNAGCGFWFDIWPVHDVTVNGCLAAFNLRQGYANEYGAEVRFLNSAAAFNYHNGFLSEGGPRAMVAHCVAWKNGGAGAYMSNYPRSITNAATSLVDNFLFARGQESNLELDYPANDCQVVNSIICNNHWTGNVNSTWAWGAYQRQEIALPATNFVNSAHAGRLSDYNVIWRDPSEIPAAQLEYYFDHRQSEEFEGTNAWFAQGWDTNSVFADPMFTDPDNLDFSLDPGSPAVGIAKVMPEVEYDYAGTRRWKYSDQVDRTAGLYVDPTK